VGRQSLGREQFIESVIAGARPSRPNGKSQVWETIAAHREPIKAWLDRRTNRHTLDLHLLHEILLYSCPISNVHLIMSG
jgi:hypothetical protein